MRSHEVKNERHVLFTDAVVGDLYQEAFVLLEFFHGYGDMTR